MKSPAQIIVQRKCITYFLRHQSHEDNIVQKVNILYKRFWEKNGFEKFMLKKISCLIIYTYKINPKWKICLNATLKAIELLREKEDKKSFRLRVGKPFFYRTY